MRFVAAPGLRIRHAGPAERRLLAAIADTPPRCFGDSRYTSDDADQRAAAAIDCAYCQLLGLCTAAAHELKPKFGVWAGKDHTPKTRRRPIGK